MGEPLAFILPKMRGGWFVSGGPGTKKLPRWAFPEPSIAIDSRLIVRSRCLTGRAGRVCGGRREAEGAVRRVFRWRGRKLGES